MFSWKSCVSFEHLLCFFSLCRCYSSTVMKDSVIFTETLKEISAVGSIMFVIWFPYNNLITAEWIIAKFGIGGTCTVFVSALCIPLCLLSSCASIFSDWRPYQLPLQLLRPQSIATKLQVGWLDNQGSVPSRDRGFALLHSVWTDSVAHPAYCPLSTVGTFLGGSAVMVWLSKKDRSHTCRSSLTMPALRASPPYS